MPATVTLEDCWTYLRESAREFDRKMEETRRLWAQSREESDRLRERLHEETERMRQETERLRQESERKSLESDRKFEETRRLLEQRSSELDKKLGRLGNRLGDFVEGLIAPSLVGLFQERGLDVHKLSRNVEANHPGLGLATQIDLLVSNTDTIVLIEVKSLLSLDDVNEHIERMEKFKPLFPEYKHCRIAGAVAGMVIPDNVAKYAYRSGFFVIAQKGEAAVILNDQKFNPAIW